MRIPELSRKFTALSISNLCEKILKCKHAVYVVISFVTFDVMSSPFQAFVENADYGNHSEV
jgi:hypothetical protein